MALKLCGIHVCGWRVQAWNKTFALYEAREVIIHGSITRSIAMRQINETAHNGAFIDRLLNIGNVGEQYLPLATRNSQHL